MKGVQVKPKVELKLSRGTSENTFLLKKESKNTKLIKKTLMGVTSSWIQITWKIKPFHFLNYTEKHIIIAVLVKWHSATHTHTCAHTHKHTHTPSTLNLIPAQGVWWRGLTILQGSCTALYRCTDVISGWLSWLTESPIIIYNIRACQMSAFASNVLFFFFLVKQTIEQKWTIIQK